MYATRGKASKVYHTHNDCVINLEEVSQAVIDWNKLKPCGKCKKRDSSITVEEVLIPKWLVSPKLIVNFLADLHNAGFAIRQFKHVLRDKGTGT